MSPVLIVGCGDIGRRVAALCRREGTEVHGLVRRPDQGAALSAVDIQPIIADLDRPGSAYPLPVEGARVFYCAPPPTEGDTDPRMRGFLDGLMEQRAERIVYISTSGVYGDCGGAWITEGQPVAPRTPRARRRLDAEQALQRWGAAHGVPVVILRVPGIYGPGRLPAQRIRRGLPVLDPSESPFTNRIHADDLARACALAAQRGVPGEVYHASDGKPTTMTDYFFRVADLLGLPRPPVVSRAEAQRVLSAELLSYLNESRRLDNRKLRTGLGLDLVYPDLESGLRSCRR
ncbi:MAG: SDR family oxidoreductase [Gammaproteobacteria bacterium]